MQRNRFTLRNSYKVSEANGVGTLTVFRVSTRGVFITMGSSDIFLAIIMVIYGLCMFRLLRFLFPVSFQNKV